jgi:hypothetical protein
MTLLIDTFIEKLRSITQRALNKIDHPYAFSGMHAFAQAAQLCDKILFSESTMRMLLDKLAHYEETVKEVLAHLPSGEPNMAHISLSSADTRGVWIQFHQAIDQIAALLLFVPSVYVKTGKDQEQLYLIDEKADIVHVLECVPGEHWSYLAEFHLCPLCERQDGTLTPCEACWQYLIRWSEIMALVAIIANQYLATMRYEEKEVTSMRRVPRQKSPGKERRIPVKHIYKVIDANEILVQVAPPEEEDRSTGEKRESWVNDGDVIREEITTRPFIRTYRHPRYVNMMGQSTTFPRGIKRMQPRKVDRLGKNVTKVKASLYEHD